MSIQASPRASETALYPANPVLVRLWRDGHVESVHRGAWALVDADGTVLEGAGAFAAPFFARSAIKCFQALPLLESGAARRFAFREQELALAIASHDGEPCHTGWVQGLLDRLGLGVGDLRCGVHPPTDAEARRELAARGEEPSALHNNCSGKHAAFLALALHLGASPEGYLDPASPGQVLVRRALAEMTGVAEEDLVPAIDGCSAPTYRLPLVALARGFARMTHPAGLPDERAAACRTLTAAAARHPELIAGVRRRLCTDLLRATGGRLFPKIGAEAVYAVGVRGAGRALAVKIDDGQPRGLDALVVALLEELGLLAPDELAALAPWRQRELENHAGLVVGRVEPVVRG